MFEMNRIPLLWADNPEVLTSVRNYQVDTVNKDKLFAVIRAAAKTTSLGVHNLSDGDINTVLRFSRPPTPRQGPSDRAGHAQFSNLRMKMAQVMVCLSCWLKAMFELPVPRRERGEDL
jgi:hypothetical protein